MNKIAILLLIALGFNLLVPKTAYPEQANTFQPPNNIVYNNGPVGGNGGEGLCMQQLVITTKDLEKQKMERDFAVREFNKAREEADSGMGTLPWLFIGLVAGAAGSYAIMK